MTQQETVQQLSSLVQLVTVLSGPEQPQSERSAWLTSALRGKRNLVQYLARLVLDEKRTKNEHRLSRLLLALVTRLADRLDGRCQDLKGIVLGDLCSMEGLWQRVLELVHQPDSCGLGTSVNALSLMVNAYELNIHLGSEREWPARIFSVSTIEAVVLLSRKQDSGSASMTSRLLATTFEYLVLAHGAHRLRVMKSVGNDVSYLLEICCQLLLRGNREPGLDHLDVARIRGLANDLIEQGGDRIYTPLALMCLET